MDRISVHREQQLYRLKSNHAIQILLDNATVRPAATVVRSADVNASQGTFLRLDDVEPGYKEDSFLYGAFVDDVEEGVKRRYRRQLSEFDLIPGKNLSYWVPKSLRELYNSEIVLDAEKGGINKHTMGSVRVGLQTGNNDRFIRNFWEHRQHEEWRPFAKGGADAWMLSRMKLSVLWGKAGAEVRRFEKSYPRNVGHYFNEALTYTVAKTSGRRFGYLHSSSIFGTKGSVFLPQRAIWESLSYTNSHLFTYLMLSQTVDRNWKRNQVARIPWNKELEESNLLKRVAKEAVGLIISKRQYDLVSPHYNGPLLLAVLGEQQSLNTHSDHPHRELKHNLDIIKPNEICSKSASLYEVGTASERHIERIESRIQSHIEEIDEAVFDCFGISEEERGTVLQEIALRTSEEPFESMEYEPKAITEPSDDFPEQIKDLLLHLVLRAINNTNDGIIPISDINGKDGLLTHITSEFERIWDEHAAERLAEADKVLGNKSTSDEAYPNLRTWLERDLFEHHVSKFDRTPVLWRFSTKRLVSDPEGEGFGCLVDYHNLDASIFDRLQNQYLEPRRTYLRERRAAMNSRRNDQSLSASERAEAAEEYERCESGIEQISIFEEQLGELAESDPRDWPDEKQERAAEAAQRVAEFRDRTTSRLDTLETLADLEEEDMEDLFSPSFYETVQENKAEWIDALNDLEAAFESYAADSTEPVEAHFYDLFEYYDDLTGSSHYASNGILFMTYYFNQFEDADQAQIGDAGISERQQLLSELASDVDQYKQLAEQISEDCDAIAANISANWQERALSEVTTAGYQPNHKHGVVINITPLAEKNVVPEIVDDNVL